jgi:hypothetical protein
VNRARLRLAAGFLDDLAGALMWAARTLLRDALYPRPWTPETLERYLQNVVGRGRYVLAVDPTRGAVEVTLDPLATQLELDLVREGARAGLPVSTRVEVRRAGLYVPAPSRVRGPAVPARQVLG